MIAVIIELNPKPVQYYVYLDRADTIRPRLERIDGFVEQCRYKSLDRPGWIASLSVWRDEEAVTRWREEESHRAEQEEGRAELFSDYRIRVGQTVWDSSVAKPVEEHDWLTELAEAGSRQVVTMITANRPTKWPTTTNPADCAEYLNLDPYAAGLISWDVLEDIDNPGALLLLVSWKDGPSAASFERVADLRDGSRLRQVRIVRDYGMFDRLEAPEVVEEVQLGTDCD